MTTQNWLHLLLVLHIGAFTVMAGTVVADTAISGRVRRYLLSDKPRAVNILESTAGFPRMIGLSAMILLLTGLGMYFLYQGVIAHAVWFRIKMILVVLVALNGSIVLKRQSVRLKQLLVQGRSDSDQAILLLRRNMGLFLGLELLLFLTIFFLSVFKF